jgi:predicted ATPase
LSARVDRLAPKDSALLQAASVIGRHFDPELLAVVTGETDVNVRLAAIHALDLVRFDGKSGDYAFKHALCGTHYTKAYSPTRVKRCI